MLKGNAIYKIASVVIAILVTVHVYGQRNPVETRVFTVPLTVQNQEEDTLIRSIPPTVDVQVRGPKILLDARSPEEFRASVNLKDRKAGNHRLRVTVKPVEDVVIPPELEITVMRETVTVVIDNKSRQSRALEPVFTNPAPSGFNWTTPLVQPASAALTGPEESLRRVAQLQVLVDATPRPGVAVNQRFPIQAVDADGNLVPEITVDPPTARVQATIQQMATEKEVLISADVSGVPAPTHRIAGISIAPQTIVVGGSPEILARVNFISTEPVDISGATGNIVKSVSLRLPEGVTTQSSRRVRVDITIAPRPTGGAPASPPGGAGERDES